MVLTLYRWLAAAATPVVALWLKRREALGKEDATRRRERFGRASRTRPPGTLLWMHAASVGESLSVLPLVERLLAAQPALHVLLTTGTVTSAQLLAGRLPARAFHQYVPIDTPQAARRFVAHWRPDAAVWVESELWPSLLLATHASGSPMALLNARLSAASHARWRRIPGSARRLLGCFRLIFAQSEQDAARLRELGGGDVRTGGNLKFDAPALPDFPQAHAELSRAIGSRPLWLAASTHPGEEILVARVHKELKKNYPTLLTIVVPRHPNRAELIAQELRGSGLTTIRRSQQEPVTASTDIYLADTMGELGIFYRLCPVAFIGGSLVPHGGQNPLEAARLGCVPIAGPHMHNFAQIVSALEQKQALLRAGSVAELVRTVAELLGDAQRQKSYSNNAQAAVKEQQGATEAAAYELAALLSGLAKSPISLDSFLHQAS